MAVPGILRDADGNRILQGLQPSPWGPSGSSTRQETRFSFPGIFICLMTRVVPCILRTATATSSQQGSFMSSVILLFGTALLEPGVIATTARERIEDETALPDPDRVPCRCLHHNNLRDAQSGADLTVKRYIFSIYPFREQPVCIQWTRQVFRIRVLKNSGSPTGKIVKPVRAY